jgi:glutathione S-transferase
MKMFTAEASPFGRKAVVVAREHEIKVELEMVNVYEAAFLDRHNPLRQIPTLLLDDGSAIYDSHVICQYFDSIAKKPTLYPDKDRWRWQTRTALANGLTEASLLLRQQVILPEGERSKTLTERYWGRINRGIDALESELDRLAAGGLRIDQITAATALGHIEFRHTKDWRGRCPKLAAWYDAFIQRPSLASTALKG